METGYKALRADVLRSLDLREDGFGIEPEITGEVCRRHLRVYELPISYFGRTFAEGKKITWRDGFKAVGVLVTVVLLAALWLAALVYLVLAGTAASRGDYFQIPGWLCATLLR